MREDLSHNSPGFFADCMLGRLARWMRAVGLDTLYERNIEDEDLLERCRSEGRILLTRDTLLVKRAAEVEALLVVSEDAREQLRQVMNHFNLPLRREMLFGRCTHCNHLVEEVGKEKIKGRVPPYVYKTEQRFTWCPNCDKLFWRGTHRKRFLKQVFPDL